MTAATTLGGGTQIADVIPLPTRLKAVLCEYRAKVYSSGEPVTGWKMIHVPSYRGIEAEFDDVMRRGLKFDSWTRRLVGWTLVSYLPQCGRPYF